MKASFLARCVAARASVEVTEHDDGTWTVGLLSPGYTVFRRVAAAQVDAVAEELLHAVRDAHEEAAS